MHRTESENSTSNNRFQNGPPGTRLGAAWFNSVQEELCYAIEQAGLTLKTAASDTSYTQLKEAIEILGQAASGMPSHNPPTVSCIMWFYQDAPPTPGWSLVSGVGDTLLAVKDAASTYLTGGTQAGTWTQPNHDHGTSSITVNNHQHGNGSLALAHTHGNVGGGLEMPAHGHAHTLVTPEHDHSAGLSVDSHTHGSINLTCSSHSHVLSENGSFDSHVHELASVLSESDIDYDLGVGANCNVYETVGGFLRAGKNTGGSSTGELMSRDTTSGGSGDLSGSTDSATPTIGGNADGNTATLSAVGSGGGDGTTISGEVTNCAATAITGTSDDASTTAVTGDTDDQTSSTGVSNNVEPGATASTWRPSARVGILCSKD